MSELFIDKIICINIWCMVPRRSRIKGLYGRKNLIIENAGNSPKLLKLIKKYTNKAAGYKVNIENLVAFTCMNNELPQKEIKILILFLLAIVRIK